MPVVDLDQPGWEVWTGQFSWQRPAGGGPLAGELLAALHTDERLVVSLSKAALPLLTAVSGPGGWRIEFAEENGARSGVGRPPDRFIWFRLPRLLTDHTSAIDGWSVQWQGADELLLENRWSEERVRVIVDHK